MPKEQNDGAAALRRLKADLAGGTVGSLYLFHGEETYLRDHYVGEIKRALIPQGTEAFHFHRFSGKGLTAEALEQAADALPLSGARTMLLVDDYDIFKAPETERERLTALFKTLPDYVCLIFVYDAVPYKPDHRMKNLRAALTAHGQEICFSRQGQEDLVKWIRRRFAALQKTISPGDAEYLLFLCGGLMTNLVSEVEKIGAYAKGSAILRTDIDAVASPVLDAAVFQMTDAVLAGKYDRAAALLSELMLQQEEPISIVAVLGRQMRQIYSARLALDAGRDAGWLAGLWLRLSPWAARRLTENARRWPAASCRQAVILCAQSDLEMKSGGDAKGTLVSLLPRLAALNA